MNREKKDELPKMQISFIDTICLPIYQSFARLGPSPMKILLNGVIDNREAWHLLSSQPYQLNIRQTNSMTNLSTTTTATLKPSTPPSNETQNDEHDI